MATRNQDLSMVVVGVALLDTLEVVDWLVHQVARMVQQLVLVVVCWASPQPLQQQREQLVVMAAPPTPWVALPQAAAQPLTLTHAWGLLSSVCTESRIRMRRAASAAASARAFSASAAS